MEKAKKLLVVGQTPPPYHGQAIMMENFLRGEYPGLRLYHLRMRFSDDIAQVGEFQVKKLWELVRLVAGILYYRLRHGIPNFYYPPAGGSRVPVFRDLAILPFARRLFARTIFHFHAAGLADMYDKLTGVLRPLYRWSYHDCDLAIKVSNTTLIDTERLRARRTAVVANGIEDLHDVGRSPAHPVSGAGDPVQLLYLGAVMESKGILDLLEACRILREEGHHFRLKVVGEFWDRANQDKFEHVMAGHHLDDRVSYLGSLYGEEKDRVLEESDIFCFPSYYEAETSGLVAMEAMRSGLPVVATTWSGIPEVVADGETGFLVPPRSPAHLAEKLRLLLQNRDLRSTMGRRGRERYEARFTVRAFQERMAEVLAEVCV